MNSLAAQVIIQILTQEMDIDPSRIWVLDQNRLIPTDQGAFYIVGLIDAHVMQNSVRMEQETVGSITAQHQINEVMQCETIQIDMLSRNNDSILRNWEIMAALNSYYAQQQQELNNFRIFPRPMSIMNTSSAEGGSNINRYTITVPCFVWYRKDTVLDSPLGDYYDDFTQKAQDEASIQTSNPLFSFEITPDSPPPIP